MTLFNSANRASKISEFFRVFKLALALTGGSLGLSWMATAQSQVTVSEPGIRLPIADQVPLNPAERYILEVAKDPGFSQIVLKAEVLGATLAWDAPGEGVYHWRLARLSKKNKGGDVVTFVSGSAVALDANTKREKPARIFWEPAPGADRYKLNFVDNAGKANSVTIAKTEYVVPASSSSMAVEVIPYTRGHRTFRDFHFNPTLKLDPGLPPPPPPPPPPAPVAVPEAPQVAAQEEVPAPVEVVKVGSRHMVHLYGLYVRENLTLSKLELQLSSEEGLAGFGGRIWTQPTDAFVVSAEGSGYRHTARLTQPELLGDQAASLDIWRYTGHILAGINFLSPFGVADHVFVVSGGGALTRMPFLPVQYTVAVDDAPRLVDDDRPLLGGGVAYGWFGEYVAVTLEGSRFMDQEGEGTLSEGRGLIQFRVSEGISIDLGGYGRLTQLDTCAADAGECLAQGTVTAKSVEKAGTLGLSARL